MPESEAFGSSTANEPEPSSLSERLAEVELERDQLRSELDARENDSVASWLEVVGTESRILGDIHNTLSWRITKPLRFVRKVQIKAVELGPARFSQLAVADLKRRHVGRRR
ncbi:hypothetical protein E3O45_12695 [Cryobacterium sp. TMS1-20-1]|uniref:hypothetical protein n=1 Tax=unclassified Cryobacterium TaxID=2649013 RepID=UPI00106A4CCB|nr:MULTISPECIES: hypothetical protein [unclassified Cryobacterium]TFC72403.1 hypothetical protein E3O45_12695 [Cryobacterium sp. TMS1-20-1]TFD55485.1 hypothetical protein E3T43_11150 [Cryobacterium sp. Hh7]